MALPKRALQDLLWLTCFENEAPEKVSLASAIQKHVSSIFRFFFATEMDVWEKLEVEEWDIVKSFVYYSSKTIKYLFIRMYV